jgi:ribulose-phosphate 3-epimerase
MKRLIAPSILSADFANLCGEVKAAAAAGADWLHVDVMDGHFVPNLTIGPAVVERLRACTHLPLDTHLMVTDPAFFIPPFAKAGADLLSFHVEVKANHAKIAGLIRGLGKKAGICINPRTPLKKILSLLPRLDLVTVMSVQPGFAGQKFMMDQLPKTRELAAFRKKNALKFLIEVDGGINADNAGLAWEAGADVLVAGTAVFGKKDYKKAITALRVE